MAEFTEPTGERAEKILQAARETLEAGQTIGSGAPELPVMKERAGLGDITGKERDWAFAKIQAMHSSNNPQVEPEAPPPEPEPEHNAKPAPQPLVRVRIPELSEVYVRQIARRFETRMRGVKVEIMDPGGTPDRIIHVQADDPDRIEQVRDDCVDLLMGFGHTKAEDYVKLLRPE